MGTLHAVKTYMVSTHPDFGLLVTVTRVTLPESLILMVLAVLLQGMHESVRLTPHASDPQDMLATWHALKALPSTVHAVNDVLNQHLTHLQTDRQQLMLSSADAKADLMGCLEAVAGHDHSSQAMARAVKDCMLGAFDKLQVLFSWQQCIINNVALAT